MLLLLAPAQEGYGPLKGIQILWWESVSGEPVVFTSRYRIVVDHAFALHNMNDEFVEYEIMWLLNVVIFVYIILSIISLLII